MNKQSDRVAGVDFANSTEARTRVKEYDLFHPYVAFTNCKFDRLNLTAFDLSWCYFDACSFFGTRLGVFHHSEFYSCDLRQARFGGADFRDVKALNCRVDGADFMGIQTTLDCNFWPGLKSELDQDRYLLLYWLTYDNPQMREIAKQHIPERVRSILQASMQRG